MLWCQLTELSKVGILREKEREGGREGGREGERERERTSERARECLEILDAQGHALPIPNPHE